MNEIDSLTYWPMVCCHNALMGREFLCPFHLHSRHNLPSCSQRKIAKKKNKQANKDKNWGHLLSCTLKTLLSQIPLLWGPDPSDSSCFGGGGSRKVCLHLQTTALPSHTPTPSHKEETLQQNSSHCDAEFLGRSCSVSTSYIYTGCLVGHNFSDCKEVGVLKVQNQLIWDYPGPMNSHLPTISLCNLIFYSY